MLSVGLRTHTNRFRPVCIYSLYIFMQASVIPEICGRRHNTQNFSKLPPLAVEDQDPSLTRVFTANRIDLDAFS